MPQERQRWFILKIQEQGTNLSAPADWWFIPWERDVPVPLFGRAVFPCEVLGCTSCKARALRPARHMAAAPVGLLSNDKRGSRGRFQPCLALLLGTDHFLLGKGSRMDPPQKHRFPSGL